MMLGRFLGLRSVDILFVCSSPIDEVWVRSTALACHSIGMQVELAVCGRREDCPDWLLNLYRQAGVKATAGISLAAAARYRCQLAVTASSGLDRKIFPTRAGVFIHMPHSLASLHMIYPAEAFDGYDAVFAAGPQHAAEFSAIASTRGLAGRHSFAIGYGKLDVLVGELAKRAPRSVDRPLVLIAPSWGSDNLLDRSGVALASCLARSGFDVVIRPHPLFFLDNSAVLGHLMALQESLPNVRLESPFAGDNAIFDADVLVGDYSGIGFEFAALRRRPVVSVGVGLKVSNPSWESLGLLPVEIACRARLGPVVPPDIDAIVEAVRQCSVTGVHVTEEAVASFLYGQPGQCAERAVAKLQQLLS